MRLDEEARENLEAAERLLPDESGAANALSNAAASRAYYAAYLAVADRALRDGWRFTDAARIYFRHDQLPSDAVRWGVLGRADFSESRARVAAAIKAWVHAPLTPGTSVGPDDIRPLTFRDAA